MEKIEASQPSKGGSSDVGAIDVGQNSATTVGDKSPASTTDDRPALSPRQNLVIELWNQQFNDYLNGKPFVGLGGPTDSRENKSRVMSFGLDNFDNMDYNKDGKLEKDAIFKNHLTTSDPLGAQLMLQNFDLIDRQITKDGSITKSELAELSKNKVQLEHLPVIPPSTIPTPAGLEAAQAKTQKVVFDRIDQHAIASPGNYFDTALKGMAKAVINGDATSLDKMVKNFAGQPAQSMELLTARLNQSFSGAAGFEYANVGGNHRLKVFQNVPEHKAVLFSSNDKPLSYKSGDSAVGAMMEIGDKVAKSSDVLAKNYASRDAEVKESANDKRLVDGLTTKLTDKEKAAVLSLVRHARQGGGQFERDVDALLRRPQELHNVSKALNELTAGKDINFQVVSIPGMTNFQARNDKGDMAYTWTLGRNGYQGSIGTQDVRASNSVNTRPEAMRWVTQSINQSREKLKR